MTLQSAIDAELPNFRREAESRMLSRCTIRRRTGETTTDADGWEVPEWEVARSGLRCRLTGSDRVRTVLVGDSEVQVAVRELHVPVGTAGLHDGDLADITTGENAGKVYELVEVSGADQQTALRIPAVETTRPGEWA